MKRISFLLIFPFLFSFLSIKYVIIPTVIKLIINNKTPAPIMAEYLIYICLLTYGPS